MDDFAREVSKHSGKDVKYVNQSEAEYTKTLEGAGLPPPVAALLASTSYLAGEGQLYNDQRQLSALADGRPRQSAKDQACAGVISSSLFSRSENGEGDRQATGLVVEG